MAYIESKQEWRVDQKEVTSIDLKTPIPFESAGFIKKVCFLGYTSDNSSQQSGSLNDVNTFPNALRKSLSELQFSYNTDHLEFFDAGDIHYNSSIEKSMVLNELQQGIFSLITGGYLPILLGGSSEISFGNYSGAIQYLQRKKYEDFGIVMLGKNSGLASHSNGITTETFASDILSDSRHQKVDTSIFYYGLDQNLDDDQKALAELYNIKYASKEDILNATGRSIAQAIKFSDQYLQIMLSITIDNGLIGKKEYWSSINQLIGSLLQTGKALTLDFSEIGGSNEKLVNVVAKLLINVIKNLG